MSKDPLSAKRLKSADALHLFPDLLSPAQKAEIARLAAGKKAPKRKLKTTHSGIVYSDDEIALLEEEYPEIDDSMLDPTFDVMKLMRDAEDPVTGTLRDLKIDDRDLKQAKNFYDFSFNIIGRDANPPWSKQLWTGAMLFGEICPCCSDKRWLDINNVPKEFPSEDLPERLMFLENGVCPKCKRKKWELIKDHGLRNYVQLDNVLGQRSGKSSSAANYAGYLTHRHLKFPNLASLSPKDMQASTELTGTFVSLNFAKALGVLWTPYKRLIEASSWFKDYFAMLDHYKEKYGKELYRTSTMYMSFFHKNLRFYPSGPRSSTLRGDTRVFALLDELGLFPVPSGDDAEDETSERANADEAHKSLTNSLVTVQSINLKLMQQGQSAAPPAVMMCVSSPIHQRDKVMRLLKESRTEEGSKYILGINLPTWEVNPSINRDSPIVVMAYNSNPQKAERDFGANPPSIEASFIGKSLVDKDVFVNGNNSHNFAYLYDQPGEIHGKVEKIRTYKYPGVVTIDAGVVNNSFTITGGHYNFETGKTVCTTIIEVMPHDNRRINFNLVYNNIILPVCKDLNAVALIADQWQSIDILHRAREDMGLNPKGKPRCLTKQFSPRRKHFDSVVSMLQSKNLLCPTIPEKDLLHILGFNVLNYKEEMFGKPVAHLLLQMLTVQDIGLTRTPGKGEGFTDDIFRSFTLLATLIHEPKVMERLKEALDFNYAGTGGGKMPTPIYISRSAMGAFRY